MDKTFFIKEFQFSRRMQRIIARVEGESQSEYDHRVKIAKYGLEGEDRANYQLKNIRLPLVCLSDLRISELYGSAQADFVVISKDYIYLLEVKNLYGSIRVTDDGQVIRIIPRERGYEREGMENPFTQIKHQADVFRTFLDNNNIELPIKTLIVMGNPRTAIFQGDVSYPIIRYDKLNDFFVEEVKKECSITEYDYIVKVGEILRDSHKDRFFNDFNVLQKRISINSKNNPVLDGEDFLLYEELLELRREIAKRTELPLCNIFLNRDAENLVLHKPVTKEEFILVPGFKERKYLLCGEEAIAIIKKYITKK